MVHGGARLVRWEGIWMGRHQVNLFVWVQQGCYLAFISDERSLVGVDRFSSLMSMRVSRVVSISKSMCFSSLEIR